MKQSFSNGHVGETLDPETHNRITVETNIKSTMQLFVKFSSGIILDSWGENIRYVHVSNVST